MNFKKFLSVTIVVLGLLSTKSYGRPTDEDILVEAIFNAAFKTLFPQPEPERNSPLWSATKTFAWGTGTYLFGKKAIQHGRVAFDQSMLRTKPVMATMFYGLCSCVCLHHATNNFANIFKC